MKKKQETLYWKKVHVSLGKLTHLFTQKKKDLQITAIEYDPQGRKCQMCEHDPIRNLYILTNLKTNEKLKIGSECATNYCDSKLLLRASGLLRKEIFADKFKDIIAKINNFKYKTKAMRTYLYNVVEKGNYPWKELLTKLENDYRSVTPAFTNRIVNFVKANPTRWIAKEIQKEFDNGNLPSDWQLKEMEKAIGNIAKKKTPKNGTYKADPIPQTNYVKPVIPELEKENVTLSKEAFNALSLDQKKEYSKNIFREA